MRHTLWFVRKRQLVSEKRTHISVATVLYGCSSLNAKCEQAVHAVPGHCCGGVAWLVYTEP